jgi:hypothetical protein
MLKNFFNRVGLVCLCVAFSPSALGRRCNHFAAGPARILGPIPMQHGRVLMRLLRSLARRQFSTLRIFQSVISSMVRLI